MLPDYHLRTTFSVLPVEMSYQRVKGIGHVGIAYIPRSNLSLKHGAIVFFSVLRQPGILFCIEKFILRHMSIAPAIIFSMALQFDKFIDYLGFTCSGQTKTCFIAVHLCIFTKVIKAGVAT